MVAASYHLPDRIGMAVLRREAFGVAHADGTGQEADKFFVYSRPPDLPWVHCLGHIIVFGR